MSERLMYEFPIQGATYYDGAAHQIVNANCTLTNERLIIRDARGRTQQVLIHDLSDVTPHLGIVNKSLDLHMGNWAAMHIYGKKPQLLQIADMLNEAIGAQFV